MPIPPKKYSASKVKTVYRPKRRPDRFMWLQRLFSRKKSGVSFRRRGTKRHFLRQLFWQGAKYATILGIWLGLALALCVLYWVHDLPEVEHLTTMPQGARKITVYARDQSVLSVHGDLRMAPLAFSQIPPHLVSAVVATEDRRFFEHSGVDVWGILRASVVNFRAGRVVQGGSTITQQLAKIAFLTPERSMKRKVQELALSLAIEHQYSKEAILTMYLNRAYMGAGIYGVGAASHYYFGKPIRELGLFEAAVIAGLLKAPSKYSPIINIEQAKIRAIQILINMHHFGLISKEQVAHAREVPLHLNTANFGQRSSLYLSDYAIEQAENLIGGYEGNLKIYTSCDTKLQEKVQAELATLIANNRMTHHVSQGAVVVMTPKGEIRAMVGGTNYLWAPFNRAVKAFRQPGSAFKTLVYASAFEAGASPDDILDDHPIRIGKWQPRNMTRGYTGPISVRSGFARSINTIAVQLFQKVGATYVANQAVRMGIHTNLPHHPSMALGALEVRLVDLTSSYAVIANHGFATVAYAVTEIRADGSGALLYDRAAGPTKRVLSQQAVAKMVDVMQAVIAYGTGKKAALDRPAAGKTGTTQEHRDAWFLGFTPQLVTGVWLGNDDNTPMKQVSGGTLPALLWKEVMLMAHQSLPVLTFGEKAEASVAPAAAVEKKSEEKDGFFERLFGLF